MTASPPEREVEILALLMAGDPHVPLVERVCEVSADLLDVSGAGVCLVGGRRHQVIVHGTDPAIQELEDLQVIYGQGPCIESVQTGAPVLVEDLTGYRTRHWQTYADEALARNVRAVFAFPIRDTTAQLGGLDLYRLSPGPLNPQQIDDAVLLTTIAARAMLAQKDRIHLGGTISALHWLTATRRFMPNPRGGTVTRGAAVDLGVTVEQASTLLRHDPAAHALGSGSTQGQNKPARVDA